MVLSRWGELQKFGFISGVDKYKLTIVQGISALSLMKTGMRTSHARNVLHHKIIKNMTVKVKLPYTFQLSYHKLS